VTTIAAPIRPIGHEYVEVGALDTNTIALITLALHHVDDQNPYRDSVIELATGEDAATVYSLLAEYTAKQIRERTRSACATGGPLTTTSNAGSSAISIAASSNPATSSP
jgi:hypothetical protein